VGSGRVVAEKRSVQEVGVGVGVTRAVPVEAGPGTEAGGVGVAYGGEVVDPGEGGGWYVAVNLIERELVDGIGQDEGNSEEEEGVKEHGE